METATLQLAEAVIVYNRLLDTFLAVADNGSFSKAAEFLHISSPAVIKQINNLEGELGLPLFYRTAHGVSLTEAGFAYREESKRIISASKEAESRIRGIGMKSQSGKQIRIGSSLLRPAQYFLHLWSLVYGNSLDHRIRIIPFLDNRYDEFLRTVHQLGDEIDFIAGPYPVNHLDEYHCSVLKITRIPFSCAVPKDHPLAEKSVLNVNELRGERILILRQGLSASVDEAREELEKYQNVVLVDTDDYVPETFNQCIAEKHLLLTLECWSQAHPMLKTIPINWPYGTDYGLLYAESPSAETTEFISFIRRTLAKEVASHSSDLP